MSAMSDGRLDLAIDRARAQLLAARRADGSYLDTVDVGPSYTAMPLIALRYAGCDLPPAETARVVTWLRRQQRDDGSFVAYPFAASGDLCATAAVWAALRCVGLPEGDPGVAAAWGFIAQYGGLDEVARALYSRTNFAALFVAMAGFLDPALLPMPPPGLVLNAPAEHFLRGRFDYLNLAVGMVCSGAIVDDLRQKKREAAAEAADDRSSFLAALASSVREKAVELGAAVGTLDDGKALALLRRYQNPNGSFDDTSLQTGLMLAAYRALRLELDDPGVARAAAWLRGMLVTAGDEAWFSCFTGDVWNTALAGRALLVSGTPAGHPLLAGSVSWLLDAQLLDASRVLGQGKPGAPKEGAWAFEIGNITTPDSDDTGLVLATLGMAAERGNPGDPALPPPLAARVLTAVEKACAWLEGNQCPGGGWAAFDYWEKEKPRGPMYTTEVGLISSDWLETLKNLASPPLALGSPAWEDVTARVLHGLGYAGYTVASPVVARALDFLRRQQLDHGGFWGRWMVNYLPTTACVLLGLAAVELPPSDPLFARALDFLIAHQNPDGGWGEDEESYRDPSRAGTGPSMPPLTGLVLSALLSAGQGRSEAVQRGVVYLLDTQRADGSWPNGDWLHAFFPPQSFYLYPLMTALYPLEALGRYRLALTEPDAEHGSTEPSTLARAAALSTLDMIDAGPPRPAPGGWDDAFLDAMRLRGDGPADRVVKALFEAHETEAVNALMRTLARSDEALPAGLPEVARAYFDESAALPAFADPAQLALAARFFARVGWPVATGLFCAALPQTYCAARGAKVLVYSGRLDLDVRRRILETAQLVFDVTDEGALGPAGRGVRTVQKVRLMHATLRHLTLAQGRWDMADGLPINQEDLAATLMCFSTVILSALDRFSLAISADERAAWMHLWCVVGALLGIAPALLPVDEADGKALMDAIRRRQWSASPQGATLGRALVTCMADYMPTPWLERLPVTLIRHLGGDACADLLGLPPSDWTGLLVEAAGDLLGAAGPRDRGDPVLRALDRFSAELMKAIVSVQRGGKQAPFRIPASLRST